MFEGENQPVRILFLIIYSIFMVSWRSFDKSHMEVGKVVEPQKKERKCGPGNIGAAS